MIEASCHCGSVKIHIPGRPRAVTDCNCSICRRYGVLWAYYRAKDVEVSLPLYLHTACCAADYWMDLGGGMSIRSVMVRRNVFDPLELTREPRWYVVRDARNALLEVRPLPAGTDLKRVFVAAMLDRIDAGWQLGEFSSRGGSVFFTRGAERCMVGIEAADPGQPVGYGAAHLIDSPTRPCG